MSKQQTATLDAPRVETRGPLTVAGFAQTYRCDGPNDIPALWQRLAPFIGNVPGEVGCGGYGVASGMISGKDSYQYLAGVAVKDASGLPGGFTAVEVPERRYAIFVHRGHAAALPDTTRAILSEHLPRMGLKPAGEPGLIETYDERFDPRTGSGEIELWIPVKP